MGTVVNVALVPRGVEVNQSEVAAVAAALSIQIARDFTPIWGIAATVAAFTNPKQVPIGYWPIYIEDPNKFPPDEGGVHLDKRGQPYALIETGPEWSLDASHECLEMLVDPSGNKTQANPILQQAIALGYADDQVQYVVEVCDPVEDGQYAYEINGVMVSDFITPNFYDPSKTPGTRYDFGGHITEPRQVLINGYISWIDAVTGEVAQLLNFQGSNGQIDPVIKNLSSNAEFRAVLEAESLRPAIDRFTDAPKYYAGITQNQYMELEGRRMAIQKAAIGRATAHNIAIEEIVRRR